MDPAVMTTLAAVLALLALLAALGAVVAVQRQGAALQHLRVLAEQARAGLDGGFATQRGALADTERALGTALDGSGKALRAEVTAAIEALRTGTEQRLGALAEQAGRDAAALRAEVGAMREGNEQRLDGVQRTLAEQLRGFAEQSGKDAAALRGEVGAMRAETQQALLALREGNEKKLAEIQGAVNEQLAKSVETQMQASFARVTEQFAQVQKAMGEMQAVGAQIGDLKRLFGNVKTRGGWGETQVRAMLEDILPATAYETNWRPRPDSRDVVEFAILMPGRDGVQARLPVDAKFPTEDYERLLAAQEAGDAEADRVARAALARRIQDEARKMREKYIFPPVTVDFAVMYLPTDGLYAEVARVPGLIDGIGREHRVIVLGPTLFPALLRTIHLGHVTLSLERKAEEVGALLGATRTEMRKMDETLERLHKQSSTLTSALDKARSRTRQVDRKLKAVTAMDPEQATRLLGIDDGELAEEETAQ